MFGNIYDNPYSSSNPYAESTMNLLTGIVPGEEQQSKNGENDLPFYSSVFCFC